MYTKQREILRALVNGRRLKVDGSRYRWADGAPGPSLAGDLVSWLYRGDLVEDECYEACRPAYGTNLTGYVIVNTSGELFLNQMTTKRG